MVMYTVENPGERPGHGARTLHIEGDVTFGTTEKAYGLCVDSLACGDELELDIEKVTRFDYSLVKLLCATHRTAELFHKRLTVRGAVSPAGLGAVRMADACRGRNCLHDRSRPCILFGSLGHPPGDGTLAPKGKAAGSPTGKARRGANGTKGSTGRKRHGEGVG
jgi:hypothetical protein